MKKGRDVDGDGDGDDDDEDENMTCTIRIQVEGSRRTQQIDICIVTGFEVP